MTEFARGGPIDGDPMERPDPRVLCTYHYPRSQRINPRAPWVVYREQANPTEEPR